MPRSKRDKKVSLTNTTQRSNRSSKQALAQAVRDAVRRYDYIYVFSVMNMRNAKLKNIRTIWRDSRFFMGKGKVMRLGLGENRESESGVNLFELSKLVTDQSGLLFSDRSPSQVLKWFRNYKDEEFSRAGNVATRTVKLLAGPMPQFQSSSETLLRSLGMPTRLNMSIVELAADYTVCNRGDVLLSQQTRLLKQLGIKLAKFKVTIKCSWTKDTGELSENPPEVFQPEADINQPMDQTPIPETFPVIPPLDDTSENTPENN